MRRQHSILLLRSIIIIIITKIISVVTAPECLGVPLINAVSGKVSHGSEIVISGASFGIKASAPPVVWDNCDETSITAKWDGGWPDSSSNPSNDIQCRTPIRGVGLPHSHISKYLAGSHAESRGYNAGYNVMVWKRRTIDSYPQYSFASWYERLDPAWYFDGARDNLKTFDWSRGETPYDMPNNWYGEYFAMHSAGNVYAHLNDDDSALDRSWSWWATATGANPWSGWIKVEWRIRWAVDGTGVVEWTVMSTSVPATKIINLSGGRTDNSNWGTARVEAIGGYADPSGRPEKWRYFADLYLDYTWAHVVIGDSPTYSACRIREVQIPSAWSDSSITVTVNQGAFADGDTAYLYVVDSDGVANNAGFPLTFSRSETPVPFALIKNVK